MLPIVATPMIALAALSVASAAAQTTPIYTPTPTPLAIATPTSTFIPTPAQWSLAIPENLPPKVMRNANYEFVTDPDTPQTVLRINYLQGSYRAPKANSNPRGGAQFYIAPFPSSVVEQYGKRATLEYDVYFAPEFPFHLGGKLPGIYGVDCGQAALTGITCSNGSAADGRSCWSVRIMWRKGGAGEVYLYVPPESNAALCAVASTSCRSSYGISLGRGQFTFTPGQWTRIAIHINVNTPGLADGSIAVAINNVIAVQINGIVFRSANVPETAIMASELNFSTFFGGNSEKYAAPNDTFTLFKNVAMSLRSV